MCELVAKDAGFDARRHEYRQVAEILGGFEAQPERLRKRRIWQEEELVHALEVSSRSSAKPRR